MLLFLPRALNFHRIKEEKCPCAMALNRNSKRRKAFGRIASHLNNNMLE